MADSAFLARQKTKADAEFYTAQRTAEANKVKKQHMPSSYLDQKVQCVTTCLFSPPSVAAEANTRVPPANEVQSHRGQQQNLLWQRHTPDVHGVCLCRELYQGLSNHGLCC